MRPLSLLLGLRPIAVVALVIAAIVPVFSSATTNETTGSSSANETPAHRAAVKTWEKERHDNVTQFRENSIKSFRALRDALDQSHDINLTNIEVSLLQGRIEAIKDCRARAAPVPANSSGPHSGVYSSCMAGKMKELRGIAETARKAEKSDYPARLKLSREVAKTSFESQKSAWLSANPKP